MDYKSVFYFFGAELLLLHNIRDLCFAAKHRNFCSTHIYSRSYLIRVFYR